MDLGSYPAYITGLSEDVLADDLNDLFSECGDIASALVALDKTTGKAKGYGWVNFTSEEDRNAAIKEKDGVKLKGSEIRVHRSKSKVKGTTLYIGNLPHGLDAKRDHDRLKAKIEELGHRDVHELRIKGRYCFAEYTSLRHAQDALRALKGQMYRGSIIRPQLAMSNPDKDNFSDLGRTLYVKNIAPGVTEEMLKAKFERFGTTIRCNIIHHRVTGEAKDYAFVEFEEQAAADEAFKQMHKYEMEDRKLHVEYSKTAPGGSRSRRDDHRPMRGFGRGGRSDRSRRDRSDRGRSDRRRSSSGFFESIRANGKPAGQDDRIRMIPAYDRYTGRYVVLAPARGFYEGPKKGCQEGWPRKMQKSKRGGYEVYRCDELSPRGTSHRAPAYSRDSHRAPAYSRDRYGEPRDRSREREYRHLSAPTRRHF